MTALSLPFILSVRPVIRRVAIIFTTREFICAHKAGHLSEDAREASSVSIACFACAFNVAVDDGGCPFHLFEPSWIRAESENRTRHRRREVVHIAVLANQNRNQQADHLDPMGYLADLPLGMHGSIPPGRYARI
jgi:hypothetical protein